MLYLEVSRIAAFSSSLVLVTGLYFQAYKIWKTKSAKDFTPLLIVALLIDEALWMNYGLAIHEWPVWLLGVTSLPAAIVVAAGYLKYRGGDQR